MAIPNPNPNIEDGKKCDNKTYSSNKIESLIAAATELPTPEAGDAGKVLTVNAAEDGYELDFAGHDLIDDNTASSDTVYSSSKVDTLLGSKVNTSSMTVKVADYTNSTGVAAGAIDTQSITVNDATFGIIAGFLVTDSTDIVPVQIHFSDSTTISFRVRNVGSASSTYKIYIKYI